MAFLPENPQERKYILLGFKIVGDFGATIALPVVLFVVIAQKLEGKYGGAPWLTVIGFILAAGLTAKLIVKKAKAYGQEYQKLEKDKTENNQS